MRFDKRTGEIKEADMTPMIDIVFLLIAFFMVLINFTDAEQHERIRLPSSELAKPPEDKLPSSITLQITNEEGDGDDPVVIIGGEEVDLAKLKTRLEIEKNLIEANSGSVSDTTIILRADEATKTGSVQKVIQLCQSPAIGFEKFALRAKQQERIQPSDPE